jgi:hypothetical protein
MKEHSVLKIKYLFPFLRSLLACTILVASSLVVTHVHHHVADQQESPIAASECPVCVLSDAPHTGAEVISYDQEANLIDWTQIIESRIPLWTSISSLGIASARAPPLGIL